ncbi:DUF6356 family protein [Mycetohabitans rhizoxinica]|jgi:hypothetical protein|uniref:Capsule biosynthesis protein n=1 Tax=Mycetohabitans rhizoxinica TaxID=412963 RepID=A0ABZ2PVM6_9BURK
MKILFGAFTRHPASVGESYLQHMRASFSFGGPMLLAAFAALVHGLFPFLFVKTGSTTVSRLYERMVLHRSGGALRHPPISGQPPHA